MTFENATQKIEVAKSLISFYNMQEGTRYRLGDDENRIKVFTDAIDKADSVYEIKNHIRKYVSEKKDDKNIIECFETFKNATPQPQAIPQAIPQAQPTEQSLTSSLSIIEKAVAQVIAQTQAETIKSEIMSSVQQTIQDFIKSEYGTIERKVTTVIDGKPVELEGVQHEKFETVLKFVRNNEPVFLTGPAGSGKRISFRNNIVGGNPIVPLAMMGIPNSMIDMHMKPIKAKVIDIYYDITCSCGVNAQQIEEAGEKVLGAILELEAQGYRFNLYHIDTYADCHDVDILAIKIKDAGQPLDLKRMSFMLMHPASFRIVGFDWYGKCPVTSYKCGYGRALVHDAGDSKADKIIKHIFGNNSVIFQASRIINNSYTQEHLKEVLTNAKQE